MEFGSSFVSRSHFSHSPLIEYSKNSSCLDFGPIYFESNPNYLPKMPKSFISVFDLEHHSFDYYVGYGTYYDCGYAFGDVEDFNKAFLFDI